MSPLDADSIPLPVDSQDTSLEKITRIGQQKIASPEVSQALEALYNDASQTLRVRGYAFWALQQVDEKYSVHEPVTLHVAADAKNASDFNSGGEADPFATIQRAAQCALAGDTVLIHAGEYRECVMPFAQGDSYERMITYRAAEGEKVYLKAMDVWDPLWQQEQKGCWSAPYDPLPWDHPGKGPQDRCEQVFADGVLLTHLEKKEQLADYDNALWIDDEQGRIWIRLDNARTPEGVQIERSVRRQCFTPAVRGLGYIRVQGIHMKGGAAHKWHGANWKKINHQSVLSVEGGHHWIVEENVLEWSNAQGLEVAVGGFSLPMKKVPLVNIPLDQKKDEVHKLYSKELGATIARRNKVQYNGIAGIVGIGGARDLVIEENLVVANNQKHHHRTCEEAGIKIHSMVNGIIRGNTIEENDCHGVWIDCRCEHNRISRNIFRNNTAHNIFHEISAGPLLVDNNVIVDTREDTGATGYYTHDGNHAHISNNYISGCKVGVRIRALFHRMMQGEHTTTSHNKIFNNFFSGCRKAAVSLMPEVARCEGNESRGNIYWDNGAIPFNMIENSSDVGMMWEQTELGKALGYTGGGERLVDLFSWMTYWKMDTEAMVLPAKMLCTELTSNAIREKLCEIWTRAGRSLEGHGYAVDAYPATEFVAMGCPELFTQARVLRTIWYAPHAGIAVIESKKGVFELYWSGNDISHDIAQSPLLAQDPVPAPTNVPSMALGDTTEVSLGTGWSVMHTELDVSVEKGSMRIHVPENLRAGRHAILMYGPQGWSIVPVSVSAALTLDEVYAQRTSQNLVCVTLTNHSVVELNDGTITVRFADEENKAAESLAPGETKTVKIPVAHDGAGQVHVECRFGNNEDSQTKLLSFARAPKTDDVTNAPRYEMDDFPGGLFPEGADAFVFYMERLHAGWRACYNERGIIVQVEVEHEYHIATRKDMEGIHTGDGVKVGLKGVSGDRMAVLGMAKLSETGEDTWGFCKSANEEHYPVGQIPQMEASITRDGTRTVYRALITWDMINRTSMPESGTALPFSVTVFCKDPDYKYGLQWFFGILYDTREGDESWMGTLWLE